MTEITKEQVRKAIEDEVIFGDGHTIYDAKIYENHFDLPDWLVAVHKSDTSDHKSTIFGNDGQIIEELRGVYNLAFLDWLIRALNLGDRTGSFGGRGTIARDNVRVLTEWANEGEETQ